MPNRSPYSRGRLRNPVPVGGQRGVRAPGKIIQNVDYGTYFCEQGSTDLLKFNHVGGDVTSSLGGVWTANGAMLYKQIGPNSGLTGLVGTTLDSSTSYFINTAPPASWQVGTGNFVVIIQFKMFDLGDAFQYIVDYDHNGSGAQAGWAMYCDATKHYFAIRDGTNSHVTAFTHGGLGYKDGAFHTFEWLIRKSVTKASLKVDSNVVTTAVDSGVNMNSIGAVNPAGGIYIGGNEANPEGGFNFRATIFQVGYRLASFSWSVPNYPPL